MEEPNVKTPPLWHTLSVEEASEILHATPAGLSSAEAAGRLFRFGPNELKGVERVSPWLLLLDQFRNVLIVILLVACVLSAFLGHGLEAAAIGVIVLFAALLGFFQEVRAERAIEALRRMAAPTATVLRDGVQTEIPARDLVPGDIILVRAGDRIAADARLMEAASLQVDEASLTGESVPVEKRTSPLESPDLQPGDRTNMVFSGTTATYGRGKGVVVATGINSELGRIAGMLQTVETGRTPLQRNLDRVGRNLARAAFAGVGIIVAVGLMRGQPFMEMFIFGIALAVAVVPEALPAVVTISLALGVRRMVRRNALMRRLPAVETLGSTSVICTDKTGTLTKDEMTVRRIVVEGQSLDVSGAGYDPAGEFLVEGSPAQPDPAARLLLRAATLASDAELIPGKENGSWRIVGDPTEGALVVAAAKAGLDKADLDERFPRICEIPFTSETKRMTTLHATGDNVTAYSKGAPETILGSCERLMCGEEEIPLDGSKRAEILAESGRLAGEGLRMLAAAARSGATMEDAERGMTFLGLVGMIDPPRPEAKGAIRTCGEAGIRPVMITGDHPLTARAIARELGLIRTGRVVSGTELEAMSDEELEREADSIDVFARVSPGHKLRVVTALQKRGRIVAMTGDGVNDAPALKKADIGVAMGVTGTDVAKEAAAMILTDDNFASIVAAVEEGRGIFDNIKKYLMYLLSSNIGEIGLMAGATLMGLPLPLTAVQILYVNLATDGLPALALAVDPPAPDLMRRRPRDTRTGIFTRPVVILMVTGGVWSTIVNLGLFIWARNSGRSDSEAMMMTFCSLVLIQFFKAYNFRSDRHSVLLRPFANRWLNLAILWELLLLVIIVYLPFLQKPFGTSGLLAGEWLIIVLSAFTVVPVLEVAKVMERHGWFGEME